MAYDRSHYSNSGCWRTSQATKPPFQRLDLPVSSGSKYMLCISASIETQSTQGVKGQMCSSPHLLYTYTVKGIKRKTSDDFYLQIW